MGTKKPFSVEEELKQYEDWIKQYRAGQIGEIKMQKIRLQLGTYAQRQEGVQMIRTKFPAGRLTADQLTCLADCSDKYAGSFVHFTTRQDAQLYYIKLEDCPNMFRDFEKAGFTTREACGNTVRNITASYRSGMEPTDAFDVTPYAEALYRFLVRNKFNQVMGRKFKIAFESSQTDYAGMRYHDFGFQAVLKDGKRGFRTFIGGGLGAVPHLGFLYTDFLPEEELMNLAAATVRIFDRHGERKNRMAARMKYLVKKLGQEKFVELLDQERKELKLPANTNDYLGEIKEAEKNVPTIPSDLPSNPDGIESSEAYQAWRKDNVCDHKLEGFKGVHIRLKLGDLVSDRARKLAEIARTFSRSETKITTEQNLFFPWVPEQALPALYGALDEIGLADAGALTLEDATTCPGADTCRLGITSAKGLGQGVAEAMQNGMGKYKEIARDVTLKVSGCPNGCAQHGIANIGFQGAAVKKDGKSVPSHELYLGGQQTFDSTECGARMGKFPAKNGPKVVETLLEIYSKEKQEGESFPACMKRYGIEKVKEALAPLMEIPSFEEQPDFYKDWGHENESFSTRTGIKGECAGAPVQEKAPIMKDAEEKLAQAEALLAHKDFENAQVEAYETMAQAARVPLYANLIDPFTSEQALWEFENVFVRKGLASEGWLEIADKIEEERDAEASETRAAAMIEIAKKFLEECQKVHESLTAGKV